MMRRKIKTAMVAAAAAMLTMGNSMTALADWQQLNGGDWIFTDNSGNRVRDTWRQSGEYYYYLDSNGIMARNRWIDDTYYVNGDGVRLWSQWIYTADGSGPGYEGGWFYLDQNGRAATDGWRTVNGRRYHFDSDGTMQYGWLNLDDNLYYLGDENDGSMKTGWVALDFDEDEGTEDGTVADMVSYGAMGKWFYFQENGRAVRASGGDTYVSRRINGYRYYFDEQGVMATGWVDVAGRAEGDPSGISTLKYFGGPDEGQMATGWRYLGNPEESEDNDFRFSLATSSNAQRWDEDGDQKWYYFDGNGVPKYLSTQARNLAEATVRVNGKYYFFDGYGRMQSGLLGFRLGDGSVVFTYFGADDSDGAMKRDRQTNVYDGDWERGTYYFNGSGSDRGGGYTGVRNGYLYDNGRLVQAWEDEDFQVFDVGGRLYLVNESGRVQDRNRTYRVNGEYRYEYDNGTIYYVNDRQERIGQVTSGTRMPEIGYRAVYTLSGEAGQ